MNIQTYIETRLDDQIEWYDKKSQNAQKKYKSNQTIEIVLAAFIPLLSGYATDCKLIAIIVGIFGALIAIIESLTKLHKHHENWIQYRTTCELLRYHKHLYLTQTHPYNTSDETVDNIFIRNIEDIISSENSQWKVNVMEEQSKHTN